MGLAEKRLASSYQAEKFPQWQSKINSACGFTPDLDIAWNELVKDGWADYYSADILGFNFFMPLEKTFKEICVDDMGRNALKDKIKKIKITSKRTGASMESSITGDTLNIDCDPTYERDQNTALENNSKEIMKTLEKVL